MKGSVFTVMLGLTLYISTVVAGEDLADEYFSHSKPLELSAQEKESINISQKWLASSVQPTQGANGSVSFTFGASEPRIVCAVLQVCDIALQEGEQVNSIHLGDTARWIVEPAVTGFGASEIQHLIIKPMDVGLETTLVVTTDRRTYHMFLRSDRTEFIPQVSFTYPDEALAKWQAVKRVEDQERKKQTIPATGEYLGHLNFNYEISGDVSWKPVRVYNDGIKTIIQMPKEMAQTEAPTLLVVRKEGGTFSNDETVMVNYRVQNDRYIVDAVFDRAILIAGVGNNQDRVTIQRGK